MGCSLVSRLRKLKANVRDLWNYSGRKNEPGHENGRQIHKGMQYPFSSLVRIKSWCPHFSRQWIAHTGLWLRSKTSKRRLVFQTILISHLLWLVVYSSCSHLGHKASVKRFVSLHSLNLWHSVGLLGRVISPSQGRYLTQTQNKHKQTSIPRVEFEPTILAFERAKTVHALDGAATVIGNFTPYLLNKDFLFLASHQQSSVWSFLSLCCCYRAHPETTKAIPYIPANRKEIYRINNGI
jgi:hypothetical protein